MLMPAHRRVGFFMDTTTYPLVINTGHRLNDTQRNELTLKKLIN